MALKLIDDWKKAWKFASVQINVLGLCLMGVVEVLNQGWQVLPPDVQARIPHSTSIALVLFALGVIGRMVKLKGKDDGSE